MLSFSRDDFSFQTCRIEVETFRKKVRQYVECLGEEQDDVITLLNKTIDRFNACAKSSICY
jgi:hypothetical protein